MQIKTVEQYVDTYRKSVADPEGFWSEIASHFIWKKPWEKVLQYDWDKPEFSWFDGGQLNITENCLDRHLADKADQTAIIWEPNDPNEEARKITYRELHKEVSRFANVLKKQGISKGDRVCIYLPMIPELAIAVLACARIGAIHSVVFAGFSSKSLATRIDDATCKMLLTADGGYRGTKTIALKEIADKALEISETQSVEKVIVFKRTGQNVDMLEGRDIWWEEALEGASADCPVEVMEAEDPLFILYTSGSTGKPKGIIHTTGGYMVYTAYSFINVFQYNEGDIYWCTADIGWITGHSYIVYGPLLAGATTMMFEGVPTFPDAGRFWQIVEKYKVNQFYTAPTAIRALMKYPLELVQRSDLSSLRVIGTVGEPINEEAWVWYKKNIGNGEVPIIDTWWQTETGGILITTIPGVLHDEPTYAGLPLPGVQPMLFDEMGEEVEGFPSEGRLGIKFPWPSITRGIWGDQERYKRTYFSFENRYFTGDGALRNKRGYYRITGRVDDVIIVSGHNLGTAPIEDVIDDHPLVVETAIVGFPHDVKGNALYAFIILKQNVDEEDELALEINRLIAKKIGPIAKCDKIQFVPGLPKTRSGKIMRRILRKIAAGETSDFGDISTLLNPEVVEKIILKNSAI